MAYLRVHRCKHFQALGFVSARKCDGLLELRNGLGKAMPGCGDTTQIEAILGRVRRQSNGFLQLPAASSSLPMRARMIPRHVVPIGEVRVEFQGLPDVLKRFIGLSSLEQAGGEVAFRQT